MIIEGAIYSDKQKIGQNAGSAGCGAGGGTLPAGGIAPGGIAPGGSAPGGGAFIMLAMLAINWIGSLGTNRSIRTDSSARVKLPASTPGS